MAAKVYLVGAGPGDPELLTRKAWRVLQSAGVVLHDDLVSEEILRVLPPTAQVVNVGKRCGVKGISQVEINQLMVQLAREGKIVARLKSGDPLLFGRAGEEMEALRHAGIEFEAIPGVTAALGAAASTKISLTDRRHASRVVFVTAHREGGTGLRNERHVAADTTYVIYMPGNRYAELAAELQAAGIGAEIPCVVISRATTKDETILRTTVGRLPECQPAASPSLLVVGLVAGIAAAEIDSQGSEFSSKLNEEVLQLALQHPYNDLQGISTGGAVSNKRVRVGILGATGMVGQRFVQMLEHHPEFEITALAASDRSQGKSYGEACTWRLVGDMPAFVKSMVVQPPQPPLDCDVVVSSLPSDVARSSEEAFARAGYPVISNASSFRMDEDVPLLIPEINADHLKVLDRQKSERGFSTGYIVTNPNCSTIIMALALAPLHAKFGIEAVIATTLQAVSGAGYPGVPSLDVVDNVLPFIDGEEPKMESETRKILGRLGNNSFENAPFPVSAQCHRVNVADGHMVAVRVKLAKRVSIEEVREALASYTSVPQKLKLHTAPKHPVLVRGEKDRPQPRMDRDAGGGMSVTVGRLFPDSVFDYRFVVLGHNTIRGAAGAAILNAELLRARGLLHERPARENAAPAEARVR